MVSRSLVLGGELPFSSDRLKRLVSAAGNLKVRIIIRQGNNTYNGKSLLGLMALSRGGVREVTLVVEGEGEQEAAELMSALLCEETPAEGVKMP